MWRRRAVAQRGLPALIAEQRERQIAVDGLADRLPAERRRVLLTEAREAATSARRTRPWRITLLVILTLAALGAALLGWSIALPTVGVFPGMIFAMFAVRTMIGAGHESLEAAQRRAEQK